jgi:hypothetical protein
LVRGGCLVSPRVPGRRGAAVGRDGTPGGRVPPHPVLKPTPMRRRPGYPHCRRAAGAFISGWGYHPSGHLPKARSRAPSVTPAVTRGARTRSVSAITELKTRAALSRDAMMARGCAAASPRAAQAHGVAPSDGGCRRAFGLICVISEGGRAITRGGHPKPLSCLAIPAPGARGTKS